MFNNRTIGAMRKKTIGILCVLVLFLNITYKVGAQSIQNTNLASDTISIDKRIPSLDTFIQSALENSPLLKISDFEIQQILEKIKMEKKSWSDFLFIDGITRYGQYNQFIVSDQTSSNVNDSGIKSASEQFTYYGGITVKIPLSNFLNKKNQNKILNNELNEGKLKKEQFEKDVTNMVIDEYYKLIKFYQVFQINMNVLEALRISHLKAQKDIAKGLIEINDYTNIVISKGKAEEGYYNAKSDYFAQYRKIQILTGLNLNSSK
jgi:outer membrane protein TolC